MEYSNLFVCLMGMGTVFFGLICIIILVSIMSAIVRKTDKVMKVSENAVAAPAKTAAPGITAEMVAAISAAVAEEIGTDVSAIRIRSIKRV